MLQKMTYIHCVGYMPLYGAKVFRRIDLIGTPFFIFDWKDEEGIYIISWDGLLLVLFCSSGPFFLPLNLKAETSIRQQERNLSSLTTGVWWEILKDCGEAWIFLHLGVDGSEPQTRARTKLLGFWHVKLLVLRSYNWRDKRREAKCWPQTHKTMGRHWAATEHSTRCILCTLVFLRSEETNFGGSTFEKSGNGEKCAGLFDLILIQNPASMMELAVLRRSFVPPIRRCHSPGHHLRLYQNIIINNQYSYSLLKKNVEKKILRMHWTRLYLAELVELILNLAF